MDERAWLSAALFGRAAGAQPNDLAALCRREGVAPLLFEAIAGRAAIPDAIVRAHRGAVAWQMARGAAVKAALASVCVPNLVLKGEALAHTCYAAPHLRPREDLDLLFASESDARTATASLAQLGYAMDPESWLPGGSQFTLVGPDLLIDMHWQLGNHPILGARLLFADLYARRVQVSEPPMAVLHPVDAFMHAAIHRMSNAQIGAGDRLIWLYDFVALARRFNAADYSTLVDRAGAHALAAPCLDAMAACTRHFDWPWPAATISALSDAAARERFRPERAASRAYVESQAPRLWRRLVPDATYMRARYRLTQRSSLPLAYLRRWITGLKLLWRALKRSPR